MSNTEKAIIIGVKLSDGSNFKFQCSQGMTPKQLLVNVGKKCGINQIEYFGLKISATDYIHKPDGNISDEGISGDSHIDKIFLSDDVPITDQTKANNINSTLCLKYYFDDPKVELEDLKTINLIFKEVSLFA
jgi:hypothetical protein